MAPSSLPYLIILLLLLFPLFATPDEMAALLRLKQEVGKGLPWDKKQRLCSPNSWGGVTCAKKTNTVVRLRLPGVLLNGTIPAGIFDSLTSLQVLDLSHNNLSGPLPPDLDKCNQLRELQLQNNNFSGPIPASLTNLKNLSVLLLDHNSFSGQLPDLQLPKLNQFSVSYNLLDGSIPASLTNLKNLSVLLLDHNTFSGNVPATVASLSSLKDLSLAENQLSGPIPTGICGNRTSLQVLSLGNNKLSGPLPTDLDKCTQLRELRLEKNLLSGDFPAAILSLTSLTNLSLAENNLNGSIPASLTKLKNLIVLLLNNNSFSGELPADLQLPNLKQFNVSYNRLNGSVPAGLSGMPTNAFLGMSALCGRPLSSTCPRDGKKNNNTVPTVEEPKKVPPSERPKKSHTGTIVAIVVCPTIVLVLAALVLLLYWRKQRGPVDSIETGKEVPKADGGERKTLVFLSNRTVKTYELASLLRAPAEELGKGTFGTTYKTEMDNGSTVVATKRLTAVEAVGAKEFRATVEAIGALQHPNVVELESYHYSSELKLLVYKYLPTGSLSSLLHGNKGAGRMPLIWPTRLNIALTAARGIEYIHLRGSGSCHGNIKSSNILLAPSYDAVVSDHALYQLAKPSRASGNRVPEIEDLQKVSKKADVYSFGVLLLEMLTGKQPGRPPWDSGADLLKWVLAFPREEWSDKVFDTELVKFQSVHDEMEELLQLAIDCCRQHPDNRPTMVDVVHRIKEIQAECAEPADDEDPNNASPIA